VIEPPTTAVILVEGHSDATAVAVLADRSEISLRASGVSVVQMGGATNIGHHLDRYGPRGRNVRLAGLCDLAEQDIFGRALRRADVGAARSRADLEAVGFGVCVVDLEDELIRAVGIERVIQILKAQGELGSFGTLQKQPAQRGRAVRDQLRRFISGRSGNKDRYARLLADAVALDRTPQPLALVLDRAREWTRASRPADGSRATAG
jgi:hypothetical protein